MHHQFPNTQFIGTSHSPLCASGLADLQDEDYSLVVFGAPEGDGPVRVDTVPPLRGLRADQVLTSRAFGLPETRNPEIQAKLEQFRKLLLLESRSEKQEAEFVKLRETLEQQVPSLAESEEDRALDRQLRKQLSEYSAQNRSDKE